MSPNFMMSDFLPYRCRVFVSCFTDAHRVSVSADEECEDCGAAFMDVEFHKVCNTPLRGPFAPLSGPLWK